ncbi:DNA-binding GntR family transcriptional regulator [Catenibacillus scindens]|uniref:DNA-binding GntR family transcriptional regulator n=1 Tax=Catenibacillus scindens TaxID=673271 RepID=A0A7W8M4Q3_9FIRM|nr:GntR family transcriptional regulator [Catenibacillus scindens]MBB5264250.1 DNA-binding GntR family transcriptional regulator [Catenibacillus scindens]
MKEFTMNANEYLPLRDVVFNTLREAILRGDLEPGERLMEIALANRLGVSRTPIREAIRKLELEGLVVMIPRKGAHVASITKKDLQDVLEVRTSLEILAAKLACERMDDQQRENLYQALEHFKDVLKTKDVTAIAGADVDFHDVIFASTQNARLVQILNNLREQMYRYRLEYLKDFSSHERLLQEHRALAAAIEAKDQELAAAIVRAHIENQEISVIRHISQS